MKHTGTLIAVREALEIGRVNAMDCYNDDTCASMKIRKALEKLDALIAAVPDGVKEAIAVPDDNSCYWQEMPWEIKYLHDAAKLLSEAVEAGE
ncbi:MAG: hypothetical protein ACUZ8H_05335 [Candidatus Anammoxibacter sp.]